MTGLHPWHNVHQRVSSWNSSLNGSLPCSCKRSSCLGSFRCSERLGPSAYVAAKMELAALATDRQIPGVTMAMSQGTPAAPARNIPRGMLRTSIIAGTLVCPIALMRPVSRRSTQHRRPPKRAPHATHQTLLEPRLRRLQAPRFQRPVAGVRRSSDPPWRDTATRGPWNRRIDGEFRRCKR